jgi:hypothetical protein
MPIHDWTRVEPGDFHDFLSRKRLLPASPHPARGNQEPQRAADLTPKPSPVLK